MSSVVKFSSILLLGFILFLISCKNDNDPTLYEINISITPENSGFISPTSDTLLEEGKTIELTPISSEGYAFSGWTGDIESIENPLRITAKEDLSLIANFALRSFNLNVEKIGNGIVTETIIKAKTDYEYGTLVRLEAIADTMWEFVRWEGDIESEEEILEVLVTESKSLRAVFEQTHFPFQISVIGNGQIRDLGNNGFQEVYPKGTELILIADPDTTWIFQGWNNTNETDSDTLIITIDSETNLNANFREGSLDFCVPISLVSFRKKSENDSILVLDWKFKYDKSFRYITSYRKGIDYLKTGEWPLNIVKSRFEYENNTLSYAFADFEGSDQEYFFEWDDKRQLTNFTSFHYQPNLELRFETESITYSEPCGLTNIYGKEVGISSSNDSSIYILNYEYQNDCSHVGINVSSDFITYSDSESIYKDIKGINEFIGWSYDFFLFRSPPIFWPNRNQKRIQSIESEIYIRETRTFKPVITEFEYFSFIIDEKYPRYFIALTNDPREVDLIVDSYLVNYYCGYK